ncbi:MAG: MEDS domain-containing protein [Deltaproteobacteria bacterium]|nr:MEDS domain-containing protein [Deltaproteobacteria bacterium]
MCNSHEKVPMGFTREAFPAGTHMCLIYNSESERKKLIGKFLESGILSGEKVGYFADMMTPAEVRDWLIAMDIVLPKGGNSEQFAIRDAENTYCPEGTFIPQRMLDNLKKYYKQALDEGYGGARVSGEMSWALKDIPGSERLMEYEALVNDVLKSHPVTAICQYDANKFDGATILDVLNVHPMMIVHGQIVQNPYYMKPQDFLNEYSGR